MKDGRGTKRPHSRSGSTVQAGSEMRSRHGLYSRMLSPPITAGLTVCFFITHTSDSGRGDRAIISEITMLNNRFIT